MGDRLLVGLDFGTTFTAVAYAFTGQPDQVHVIKSWPGGNGGRTHDEVPTEIAYSGDDVRFGWRVGPEDNPVRWIKLLLDLEQAFPSFASKRSILNELRKANRRPIDCVADILAEVYVLTINHLKRTYSAQVVQSTTIDFIMTVPAIWSDVSKHAMLLAAEKAGINHTITLISEPEAAACYTLKVIQPNHLRVDHHMVVADLGGGTADLITYRINKLQPLEVEESGVGSGGLCGAAFLNFLFDDLLRELLSGYVYDALAEEQPKALGTARRHFEDYIKHYFDPEDEEYVIPLPGVPDNAQAGIMHGFLTLLSAQVEDIFEPVVAEAIRLIEMQVDQAEVSEHVVSAILLVGGFGQSQYLYGCVTKHFTRRRPNLVVMQPPDASTAIARGAVLRALEGSIVHERRSRYNYGSVSCPPFDSAIHPSESRYYDTLDELFRSRNVMQWFVKKNEKVAKTRANWLSVKKVWVGENFPSLEALQIVGRLYSTTETRASLMWDEAQMKCVCTVTADVRKVPRSHFKKACNSKGRWFWTLDFALGLQIGSADIDFSLRIGDQTYGSVTTVFNA